MDINIDCTSLPLPKEVNFRNEIKMLLKTNKSLTMLKTEIFVKISRRVVLILPLIKSDFKDARQITVKNGEISDDNICQIDKFVEEADKINLANFGKQVIKNAFEMTTVCNECRESPQIVKQTILGWFEKYLELLDDCIAKGIETAMKIKHKTKCEIKKSLYNFTDDSVSKTLLDQIENGIKSVPNVKKDGISVVKGVLGEILNNLKMFRRRQQRRPPINHWRVKKWLDAAIGDIDEDTEEEHIAYYKHVRENLDKAVKIIKWNADESQCELRAKDIKLSTEISGAVFILADKNYGMSLIPVETMLQAETNMLKELDAKRTNYGQWT